MAEGLYRFCHWGFSPHLLTASYNILRILHGTETVDWYRQESFTSPRAMMSLRLFNGFRLLATKSSDAEDLKIYVETLAFRSDCTGLDASFQDWESERAREKQEYKEEEREREFVDQLGCDLWNCHKKGAQNKEPVIPDCFWKALYDLYVQYCWGRIDTLQAYG